MIWVTSDLHLNHHNILELEKFCLHKNRLDYITTIDQYNDMIINHLNEVVGESDTLYILGDFAFGNFSQIRPLFARIKCKDVRFIMGNHDRYSAEEAKQKIGFSQVIRGPMYLPESLGRIIMCHYPVREALDNPYVMCLHGHLHGSKLCLENFKNVNIAVNHYYPICLDPLIKSVQGKFKSRKERWLQEWYAEYQVFSDKNRTDIKLDETGKIILEKNS